MKQVIARLQWLAPVLVPLMLAACSGNGGERPPAPDLSPRFTSAQTASIVENRTAAYQAAASDPGGATLTFSIDGGADAARFAITPAGALTFNAAPDYEIPGDADGDNVYAVRLRVSNGTLSATQPVNISVTNDREGISVVRILSGLKQPVYIAPSVFASHIYVGEKGGNIYQVNLASGSKSLALAIGADLSTDGERGLLAFQPYYDFSGRYFALMTGTDGAVELRQYQLSSNSSKIFYESVLKIPHAANNNNNGGWIGFGPDGFLYVTVGDGGGVGDPGNNAQNPDVQLGKILRIAVTEHYYDDHAPGAPLGYTTYAPAPGNPYIGGGGDPYVYASGLRNPFRASFYGSTMIVGDIGQDAIEEINLISTTQPGTNFGWPFFEGTRPYKGTAPAGLTLPVAEYGHGSGPRQGSSIIGGYVYRGPVTELQGQYIFADRSSGNIWSVPFSSLVPGQTLASPLFSRRNEDFAPDAGTLDSVAAFGEDSVGNLYIASSSGDLFVVRAN